MKPIIGYDYYQCLPKREKKLCEVCHDKTIPCYSFGHHYHLRESNFNGESINELIMDECCSQFENMKELDKRENTLSVKERLW